MNENVSFKNLTPVKGALYVGLGQYTSSGNNLGRTLSPQSLGPDPLQRSFGQTKGFVYCESGHTLAGTSDLGVSARTGTQTGDTSLGYGLKPHRKRLWQSTGNLSSGFDEKPPITHLRGYLRRWLADKPHFENAVYAVF